jgi:lipid-A-disaccharide synthase
MGPLTVFFSAGEASGDLHAAALAAAIQRRRPDAALCGMGGPHMAKAGVELLIGIGESSVVGLTEVVRQIPEFLAKLRRMRRWIRRRRPDVVVLVDFPDFNIRLGRTAHRLGVPVVCYIPPKAWAWRPRRGRTVARIADVVVSILPFEAEFYREQGARVTYVGHPLVDIVREARPLSRDEARARLQLPGDAPVLGLLPGSRSREVSLLLGPMLEAAARVREALPDLQTVLPRAPTVTPEALAEAAGGGDLCSVRVVAGDTYNAIRACDALIAASGTVTLEAAILGVPMQVVYKLSPLTFALAKRLVRVPFSALPNLLAGREIVPEHLQERAAPQQLAETALRLLTDAAARQAQQRDLERVRHLLGDGGAVEKAADAVLRAART